MAVPLPRGTICGIVAKHRMGERQAAGVGAYLMGDAPWRAGVARMARALAGPF